MKIDVDFETTGSFAKIDAKAIAEAGARGLVAHTSDSIRDSTDPATGIGKPAIKPRTAAKPDRKGGRGYDTGLLADGIRARSTGSTIRGSSRVGLPKGRHAFVASEALRGVVYLSTEGLAAEAIDNAVSGVLEDEIA